MPSGKESAAAGNKESMSPKGMNAVGRQAPQAAYTS